MSDRYVHVIWCDDIRQEIGNKPSFMGVYTGGMVLPALPSLVPRLGVQIWASTPKDQPFKNVTIRVVRDDGVVLIETPPNAIDTEAIANLAPSRPESRRTGILAGFIVAPVELPVGCKYLTVLVVTESEQLEGPKLYVDINPAIYAQANPGWNPQLAEPAAEADPT